MKISRFKCLRCNHEWIPRTEELPETCPNPKCRSPYWNRPRKIRLKTKRLIKK